MWSAKMAEKMHCERAFAHETLTVRGSVALTANKWESKDVRCHVRRVDNGFDRTLSPTWGRMRESEIFDTRTVQFFSPSVTPARAPWLIWKDINDLKAEPARRDFPDERRSKTPVEQAGEGKRPRRPPPSTSLQASPRDPSEKSDGVKRKITVGSSSWHWLFLLDFTTQAPPA